MKNIIALFTLAVLISSCGGNEQSFDELLLSDDPQTLKDKKDALVEQQQQLTSQIKQLDIKIQELSPNGNIPKVTAFETEFEKFVHFVEIQGSVDTKQNVLIAAEMNGILERVYVKEGDRVKKGQLLAKIDDGGLSQQRAQLNIQAELAKTTFERQKRLWEQNIGSEIQYLNAKSNYEALQESVNQIDKQLSKTSVTAPFSGIIDDVITEQGNVVNAGMSYLMRIVNLDNMYISASVPESYINDITEGKHVKAYLPVLGKTMDATVRQTGSFINPSNRTFSIEVDIPNGDKVLKPNLTARLKINDYTKEEALLIPQSIISENANAEQYVYVIGTNDKGKTVAKQTIITTGKTQDDNIEVLSGLDPGVQLIQEGARSVKDGQQVRVE